MQNLIENWKLIEKYDGNYIFENENEEFQVTIDDMGGLIPRFSICFQQLKGNFTKIGIEDGAFATHTNEEAEALTSAMEMMRFINKKLYK